MLRGEDERGVFPRARSRGDNQAMTKIPAMHARAPNPRFGGREPDEKRRIPVIAVRARTER